MGLYQVIGVRQSIGPKGRFMYFYSNNILLCSKHTRGMSFQPFTTYDAEKGYGKNGCPFCNGQLKYSDCRSQKKLLVALEGLKNEVENS